MIPPTREQHDAIVAAKGRSYTADPIRGARGDLNAAELVSIIDDAIANARFARLITTKGTQ